jgi:hypothetical protein
MHDRALAERSLPRVIFRPLRPWKILASKAAKNLAHFRDCEKLAKSEGARLLRLPVRRNGAFDGDGVAIHP